MTIPTIFDWLARLEFLRGVPAVFLMLLTAFLVVVVWDWRLSLLALIVQYLVAGLLFVDALDPRLAFIKVLVGLFICLILYITGRQVNWGRLPPDVTDEEARRLDRRERVDSVVVSTGAVVRLFLALMIVLVAATLTQRSGFRLPALGQTLNHLNLAVFGLLGLGLLQVALTAEPLKAGMGVLMFLTGFELFYSVLEQSVAMMATLAGANLLIALVIAYLSQAHHAWPALID